MVRKIIGSAALALLAVDGAQATAPAPSLPAPTTAVSCGAAEISGSSNSCVRNLTSDGGPAATLFASANLESLTAEAKVDTQQSLAFSTFASLTYSLQVSSNTGVYDRYIPLLLKTSGQTEVGTVGGTSTGNNKAEARLTTSMNSAFTFYACSGAGCFSTPSSFGGTYKVFAFGNSVETITLSVSASTNNLFPASFAHAYVDPYVEIDPEFLATHPQYSLAFSSGITNAPAPVPEPASAALLLAGLALVGAAAGGRKKAI